MAVKKIHVMGAKVLREVAQPVPEKEISSEKIQSLIDDMIETASQTPEDGFITAGLAAPQVGESLRIFLVIKEGSNRMSPEYEVFINPELDFSTPEMQDSEESCLSTPGLCGIVKRYRELKVTYYTREGRREKKKISGERAIFIQHENDHLDGVLWVDKLVDTRSMAYC